MGGGDLVSCEQDHLSQAVSFFPFLSKIHFGSYCSWEERRDPELKDQDIFFLKYTYEHENFYGSKIKSTFVALPFLRHAG